ncbi:MAG: RHS repeat-associated core domain-containing protein [Verrucomicrobiota bacterium]
MKFLSFAAALPLFSVLLLMNKADALGPPQNGPAPCNNPATGTPSKSCPMDPCTGDKIPTCAGDPVHGLSGDFQMNVTDLKVWGGVGEHDLAWTRHFHSRTTFAGHFLGQGNIRHGYQWEMADAGVDSQGRPVLRVFYPEGDLYNFTKVSATVWSPPADCTDLMTQDGDDYILQRRGGDTYRFVKLQDTGGAFYYQLADFKDPQGNAYLMEYDVGSPKRLVRVTEPGGRSLRITWDVETVSAGVTLQGKINSVPPNNTWTTLSLTTPGSFRYLWYASADYGYGNVAELEFYDGAAKLSGAAFGSTPNHPDNSFTKAFDTITSTFYNSAGVPSGAVVGIDFGTARNVTSLRYFPRINFPARMYYNTQGFGDMPTSTGRFYASNAAPQTVDVIHSVSSHDPQDNVVHTIAYDYTIMDDQSIPEQKYAMLSAVDYGDGTQASFTHLQMYPGTAPVLAEYNEPRYDAEPLVRAKVLYRTGYGAVAGSFWQQRNADTNEPIMTWGSPNGKADAHGGKFWFANGATETFYATTAGGTSQMTQHIEPSGAVTNYGYSSGGAGYLNRKTDAAGRVTQWTRDANHNILTETLPDGKTRVYTRDSLGLVLTEKDENNRTTTYTRDANHRVTQINHPDSLTETFTYNSFGQLLTHTRRDGTVVSHIYDATGLKTSSTDALGKVTMYGYDSAGRLASVTDSLNRTTSYTYNLRGQITLTTFPDSSTRTATYDIYGSKLTASDEQGHTTTFTYDWYKRPLTVTDALNRTTTYDYTIPGVGGGGGCGCAHIGDNPVKITSPAGRVTYFTYDLAWRKTSVTTGFGTADAATTSYGYNVGDRINLVTDPRGKSWVTTYDARDRKTSEKNPLNQATSYTYDGVGNLLTTTLPDGRVTTNTYDAMDRLATTKDPLNQIISYGYDAMGRMVTLTDTKSNVTTWSYDVRGSLTGKLYANGDSHAYTYDDARRLATHTTPNGDVCTYSYDFRDRLLVSDWNTSTPDTTRSYDLCGQMLSIDNTVSLNTYVYDAGHQLTSETQKLAGEAIGKIVAYTYDADGHRASITYPSGQIVEYTWTPRNQLAAVTADGPPPLANYTYDLAGRLTAIAHENGVTESKTYDDANRLLANQHLKNGSPLSGHTYALDTTGRRTSETFSDGTTPARTYGYDSTDQVTSADYGSGQTDAYDYDPMGNRENATFSRSVGVPPTSGTVTYTTNSANQYTAISNQPPPPTYDANGNLLTQNGITYTWDSENRLMSVSDGTTTVIHTYDALHRRVTKSVNGTTTRYIYDGWNVIEEYSSSTLSKSLTWGTDLSGSLQGAGGVGGLLLTTDHSALITSHFHYDGNGNVTQLTGVAGTITATYRYDAFGNTLVSTGTAVGNKYRFSTKPVDEEIATSPIYYYGYRYYIAPLGRWLNRDPIGENGGLNVYGFVGNHSVGRMDVLGLDSPGCDGIPDLTPCMKEVCAQHDKCYRDNLCTSRSWFSVDGPCSQCNFNAVVGMIKCLNKGCHDSDRPNYYDAVTDTFFNDPKDPRAWNTTDKIKPPKKCCKRKMGHPAH